MSPEETKPEANASAVPAAPAPATNSDGSFWGISIGTIITTITTLLTAVAGASPWGVAAMAVFGVVASLAGIWGYNTLINSWNRKTDLADQAAAGADAGNTSTDIANQGTQINNNLDNLQGANPPVAPVKKK